MEKIVLEEKGVAFVIEIGGAGGPTLLHWGAPVRVEDIPGGHSTPIPSGPDAPTRNSLFPTHGFGFFGEPALLAHRDDGGDDFQFIFASAEKNEQSIELSYIDAIGGVELSLSYKLCAASGMLIAKSKIINKGDSRLHVHRLNALSLPLPSWATHVDSGYGGWSHEGWSQRISIAAGKHERCGRRGRPGFDGGPFLIATEENTRECLGGAIGVALAHSSNFQIAAERLDGGDAQIILAEWTAPGEIILEQGAHYQSPEAYAAFSTKGVSGISTQFHERARALTPPSRASRPVQLNSWEAAYFDIDHDKAVALANEAAAIGAERFVLDDGWFKGRTGAHAGLGDWTPDPERFPNGLAPLADHIRSLGLEFGLWVEPEMVNEDSDLYRAHPDWVLAAPGRSKPTGRNQLVLDLNRKDVRQYLFTTIDKLLSELPIQYLKWDCNRDLYPAMSNGRPAAAGQINGLYQLLSSIRDAHPSVSIESCASGGGRMDFGVLQYADRFWPSDSTDPIERVRIQRRASVFFPVELLGAHIGASPNHWTWRRSSMGFRCLTALFGHFGVELNPALLDADDKNTLCNAIVFYKTHRQLITHGNLMRLESHSNDLDAQIIWSAESDNAILRTLRTSEPARARQNNVKLPHAPAGRSWRIKEIFVESNGVAAIGEFSSEALAEIGLDASPPHAGMGRLFLLEQIK